MSEISGIYEGLSYNAVYEDASSQDVQLQDFLNLMVAQLQNQDFMNPVNDTEFLSQMATFATMQQMQELASYSKYNYTASMVGKEVTVAKYGIGGDVERDEGIIEKISFVDDEYLVYVNGNAYGLHQVMEVKANATQVEQPKLDASEMSLFVGTVTDSTTAFSWTAPASDITAEAELMYTVYYSQNENMNTVDEVKQNGTVYGEQDRRDLSTETIIGLVAGETYYMNVLVKDTEGNESVYKAAKIQMYE